MKNKAHHLTKKLLSSKTLSFKKSNKDANYRYFAKVGLPLFGIALATTMIYGLYLPAYANSQSTQTTAQAISERAIDDYATALKLAANAKNSGQIGRLIADDAIISLTRQGRGSTTLNKSDYLQLLQKSWTNTSNYRFEIDIQDVVITGNTARVQLTTTESWQQNNKTTTLITSSRAVIGTQGKHTVLLRLVAQVSLEER